MIDKSRIVPIDCNKRLQGILKEYKDSRGRGEVDMSRMYQWINKNGFQCFPHRTVVKGERYTEWCERLLESTFFPSKPDRFFVVFARWLAKAPNVLTDKKCLHCKFWVRGIGLLKEDFALNDTGLQDMGYGECQFATGKSVIGTELDVAHIVASYGDVIVGVHVDYGTYLATPPNHYCACFRSVYERV